MRPFFDDRIEVENPGILLPGLTIEDMKQGVSRIRNPVIARVFRELNLIEQWGSGVRRIFEQAEELKLPAPQIVEIGMHVRFIVRLTTPILIPPKVTRAVKGFESGAQSGAQSNRILFALSDTPLSSQEIALVMDLETKSGALKRSLKQLLAQELIEYTLPDKPNSRLQKYRLTEKGKRMKDEG